MALNNLLLRALNPALLPNILRANPSSDGGAASPLAADGYDFGTDGDSVVNTWTDGGASSGTGLAPILDDIDNASRRISGFDFSPDGDYVVIASYAGIVATYALSSPFDFETATLSGTHITGQSIPSNPRYNEDGTYITWMAATDSLKIIGPLTTPYSRSDSEVVSAATLTKTELMGYSASHDPIHCMLPGGAGVWSFGQVSAGVYTLTFCPLSTPYDFSSNGTVIADGTDRTNLSNSPTTGTMTVSADGTLVQMFSGAADDTMYNFAIDTANDPSTTITQTSSTESNITQDHDMAAWSKDYTKLFLLDGPFTPSIRQYPAK